MQPFRPIRPAQPPQASGFLVEDQNNYSICASNAPNKSRRQRHSQIEWEEIRPIVTQLIYQYSLPDVIKLIAENYSFRAGTRQWRNKLSEWGLDVKNMKKDHMKILLAKKKRREQESGKSTIFIRGTIQMDDERFSNFGKRTLSVASPSEPTPPGIEYFTPRPALDFSIEADTIRRAEKAPALAILRELAKSKESIADILQYDADPAPITILECQGLYVRLREAATSKLLHQNHLCGWNAVLGRRRFHSRAKCEECLQASTVFAQELAIIIADNERQSDCLHLSTSSRGDFEAPAFKFSSNASAALSQTILTRALELIKRSAFVEGLLGLSRESRARWLQPWSPLISTEHFELLGNYVFGDFSNTYNDAEIVSFLICFKTAADAHTLLKFTLGYNNQQTVRDCTLCHPNFMVIDLIGVHGALKVVLSGSFSTDERTVAPIRKLMDRAYLKSEFEVFSNWALTAYLYQGQSYCKTLRRCRCGGQQHRSVEKHYVDEWKEQNALKWDPSPDIGLNDRFELWPLEGCWSTVRGEKVKQKPQEPEWDPDGIDSEEEAVFDAFPEDTTEEEVLSPALYFSLDKV